MTTNLGENSDEGRRLSKTANRRRSAEQLILHCWRNAGPLIGGVTVPPNQLSAIAAVRTAATSWAHLGPSTEDLLSLNSSGAFLQSRNILGTLRLRVLAIGRKTVRLWWFFQLFQLFHHTTSTLMWASDLGQCKLAMTETSPGPRHTFESRAYPTQGHWPPRHHLRLGRGWCFGPGLLPEHAVRCVFVYVDTSLQHLATSLQSLRLLASIW